MAAVWTDEAKFAAWREVELAVLRAREARGEIPAGTAQFCTDRTWMNGDVAALVNRREKWLKHDLNAFLDIMRLQILYGDWCRREAAEDDLDFNNIVRQSSLRVIVADVPERSEEEWDALFNERLDAWFARRSRPEASAFHDGMTSYDTEEPATALLLQRAGEIIESDLRALLAALKDRALRHRGLVMMGRTHGQHAQPVTFGAKCLHWLEMVGRAHLRFAVAVEEVAVMKLSGAVGMYGTLGPGVEEAVACGLMLAVVPVATQIVALDRRAHLIGVLAEIAAVVEKIARDLWLLAQSEVGEIREPFGKKQKGSSAMPHKKNPITLEQLFGLPRLVRGYAAALLEDVATANERDISHSSVERIAVPDAFGLTDHMLRRLAGLIAGMEVDAERMRENVERSYGTYASQRIERFLKAQGVAAEKAYRLVQDACFQAVARRTHIRETLAYTAEKHCVAIAWDGVESCFDPAAWVGQEATLYRRMGLVDAT